MATGGRLNLPELRVNVSALGMPLHGVKLGLFFTSQSLSTERAVTALCENGTATFGSRSVEICGALTQAKTRFPHGVMLKALVHGLPPSCLTLTEKASHSSVFAQGGLTVIGTAFLDLETLFSSKPIPALTTQQPECEMSVTFHVERKPLLASPSQAALIALLQSCHRPMQDVEDVIARESHERANRIAETMRMIGGEKSAYAAKEALYTLPVGTMCSLSQPVDVAQHAVLTRELGALLPDKNMRHITAALQLCLAGTVHEMGLPATAQSIAHVNGLLARDAALRRKVWGRMKQQMCQLTALNSLYTPDSTMSGASLKSENGRATAHAVMKIGEDQNVSGTDTMATVDSKATDFARMLESGRLLNGQEMTPTDIAALMTTGDRFIGDCEDVAVRTEDCKVDFGRMHPATIEARILDAMTTLHSNKATTNITLAKSAVLMRQAYGEVEGEVSGELKPGGLLSGVTLGFAAGAAMGQQPRTEGTRQSNGSDLPASDVFEAAMSDLQNSRVMGHAFGGVFEIANVVNLNERQQLVACRRVDILESTAPTRLDTTLSSRDVELTCKLSGFTKLTGKTVSFDTFLAIKSQLVAEAVSTATSQHLTPLHVADPGGSQAFWQNAISVGCTFLATMTCSPTPPRLCDVVTMTPLEETCTHARTHALALSCRCVAGHEQADAACSVCPHCNRCEWPAHLRAVHRLAEEGQHTSQNWQALHRTSTTCGLCGRSTGLKAQQALSTAALVYKARSGATSGGIIDTGIEIYPLPSLTNDRLIVGINDTVQQGSEEAAALRTVARMTASSLCPVEILADFSQDGLWPFEEHYPDTGTRKRAVDTQKVNVFTTIPQAVRASEPSAALAMARAGVSFEAEAAARTQVHPDLVVKRHISKFLCEYEVA